LTRRPFVAKSDYKPAVTIVGGGMITQVQILPSIYQLQRLGTVGEISITALNGAPLKVLGDDPALKAAFPGQGFVPFPNYSKVDLNAKFPDLYKEVIEKMPARNIVVVAVPDQLHYSVIKFALEHNQHIMTVKPLVLRHDQAVEIEKLAYERGLFVGIEYHKRFDDRNFMARSAYRAGKFGEFRLGNARLIECWYYRHSNFQNWMTTENSDSFAYIACHYIDLVHFITGLLPTAVSVYGIKEKYPNGNDGFLWTDGRILWENGACLNVQNGLGYPDDAPGGNDQGMTLYCAGKNMGAMISHSDQYRGVKHSYLAKGSDPGDTIYAEPNPDYFRMIATGGEGLTAVGYGYRSIAAIIGAACRIEKETAGMAGQAALTSRRELIRNIDEESIIATPANSAYNELVMEAGRKSILAGGREVVIEYGAKPCVSFRAYD
jgi:D-galacturonate reductase